MRRSKYELMRNVRIRLDARDRISDWRIQERASRLNIRIAWLLIVRGSDKISKQRINSHEIYKYSDAMRVSQTRRGDFVYQSMYL